MRRVLLLFVDGVGVGEDEPSINPLAAARLVSIRELLGGRGPFRAHGSFSARRASCAPLDATLGVPGLPQSGTGHVTLLTGENAAQRFGRHFGPWVPTTLRALLAERSILRRARDGGLDVAFANAYPEEVMAGYRAAGHAVRGATPLRVGFAYAALTAGLLWRQTPELARGDAVSSEIVNDGWIEKLGRHELPRVSAAQAGASLARIAAAHDLTVFAHYATDHIGHRGTAAEAVAAVERVDAFIGAACAALPGDALLVLVSDHGNLEDTRAGHTLNPALCVVVGDGHAEAAARLASLVDVAGEVELQLGLR